MPLYYRYYWPCQVFMLSCFTVLLLLVRLMLYDVVVAYDTSIYQFSSKMFYEEPIECVQKKVEIHFSIIISTVRVAVILGKNKLQKLRRCKTR